MTTDIVKMDQEKAKCLAETLLKTDAGAFPRVIDGKSSRTEECILIKCDDEYVGFVNLASSGDGACEIYRFFIVPDRRYQGVGKVAAQKLIEEIKRRGLYEGCYLEIASGRVEFWKNSIGELELLNEDTGIYYKAL